MPRPKLIFTEAEVRRVQELYPEGASHEEIAEVLGCSAETIRTIDAGALRKLRANEALRALHAEPAIAEPEPDRRALRGIGDPVLA